MGKYEQLAKDIVKNVGGKENIDSLTHCVTRLRFQLKDESIAKTDVLKNMDGVVTVMQTAGQYQVVIGNHVPEVYDDVCQVAGLSGDVQTVSKKKMSVKDRALDLISGIMMPSIGMLCACGMIKGLNTILLVTGLLKSTDGFYVLLNAVGDSMFFFFPVVLGYNTAKKFGMNPFTGMMIGAALCHPTINNVEGGLNLFGYVVQANYTSSILPPILVVAFAAPLERFFNKVIPDVVKTFLVPMLVLLIAVPIGYAVIGPAANLIGYGLTVIMNGAYEISPILAGALLGAGWQIFVMFGVHMVVMIGSMMNLLGGTADPILPLVMSVSFAQTAVVFAVWLKTKNKKLKDIALPAWISGVFGVTEPAIYGVSLPRLPLFIISCIGGAIVGMIYGAFNLKMYTMGGMGIFAIPAMIDPANPGFTTAVTIGGIVVCMIFSFVAAWFAFKDDEETTTIEEVKKEDEEILSPLEGQVKPLSEATDQAFAEGLLGKGVVIVPTVGKVVAPFDGTIVTLFPTKHAIGIKSDRGCELLIHLGIDTVQLNGKYFTAHVEQGAHVKKGDVLMTFDLEAIQKEGYITESPVIITNSKDYLDIVETQETNVNTDAVLMHGLV